MTNSVPASAFRHPVHFLAIGLGSGAAPRAPGTVGTLAAIPFYLLLAQTSLAVYGLAVVLAFALGIYLCGKTAADWGTHDHGAIVWDEFVGFWITLLAVPLTWYWVVIGFLVFRLFDIWKPWPIRVLDKQVHGGLGIMIDDVVAGVYACLVMHLLVFIS